MTKHDSCLPECSYMEAPTGGFVGTYRLAGSMTIVRQGDKQPFLTPTGALKAASDAFIAYAFKQIRSEVLDVSVSRCDPLGIEAWKRAKQGNASALEFEVFETVFVKGKSTKIERKRRFAQQS